MGGIGWLLTGAAAYFIWQQMRPLPTVTITPVEQPTPAGRAKLALPDELVGPIFGQDDGTFFVVTRAAMSSMGLTLDIQTAESDRGRAGLKGQIVVPHGEAWQDFFERTGIFWTGGRAK